MGKLCREDHPFERVEGPAGPVAGPAPPAVASAGQRATNPSGGRGDEAAYCPRPSVSQRPVGGPDGQITAPPANPPPPRTAKRMEKGVGKRWSVQLLRFASRLVLP